MVINKGRRGGYSRVAGRYRDFDILTEHVLDRAIIYGSPRGADNTTLPLLAIFNNFYNFYLRANY